jgi:uncharacterized repeat protein (TIGR01451 family)
MPPAKRVLATALPVAAGLLFTALLLGLLGAFTARAVAAPLNAPAFLYVATTGVDAANNCNTSTAPCQTVQYALDSTQAGDEIHVAAGVYSSPDGTVANIIRTVTLQGGWDSTFSQYNPAVNVTTLDGQGLQPVVVISSTALTVSGQPSPTIQGFVITHGHGQTNFCGAGVLAPADDQCGGGIASLNAYPLILNNVITDNIGANFTFGLGGGIYLFNAGAASVISGNLVYSNVANIGSTGLGGGISVHNGLAVIQGNTIQRNLDSLSGSGNGAGIKLLNSTGSIIGNDIRENVSINRGGGIHVSGGSGVVVIRGNTILSNTAAVAAGGLQINSLATLIENNTIAYNQALSPSAGRGGGLRVSTDNAGVIITHNDMYSNVAGWGGGSAIDLAAPGVVDGNYLHDNQNGQWGAALVLTGTALPMTATNNVIVNNLGTGLEAGDFGPTLAIVNNTISGNRAISGSGGTGILVTFDLTPSLPITATIVNNILLNGAGCGLDINNPPAVISHHNDVLNNATNYCGAAANTGDLSVNPLFVNPSAGDYHLSVASPLIDAGSNPEAPASDKDGVSRPQGPLVDIGAYEALLVADLRLTQSVTPKLVLPGQPIIFTLVYTNTGPRLANHVLITDLVPAGLTQVTYNASGALITATGSATFTWQVQDLPPGMSGLIHVIAIVDPVLSSAAALTNSVSISSTAVDLAPGNNTSNVGATLAYPLSVVVTGTGSGSLSSLPPGIACGVFCLANYAYGTVVTLTAAPAGGSYLTGWSGFCSGRGLCLTTIHGPQVITATFGLAWLIDLPLIRR